MEYTISSIAPIFLGPFLAFALNCLLIKKAPKLVDKVSVLGIVTAFVFAARIFFDFMDVSSTNFYVHKFFNYIDLSFGENIFKIDLGIYIDNMSAIMLLMVTGVASLIHIFSTWYMHGDVRYERFFLYLSLFTSAMLGLVLADNLLTVFIFWELMGFCSYSLIGFYFEKEKAGYASIKAFMTTRVGDVFFLLGILAIWSVVGNVNFVDIYAAISNGAFEGQAVLGIGLATFAGFCVFCGTIGKSAQFPLQVWLPDAMMGPTPCSALIHAATMVAAGVYLSLRMYPLMELGELTNLIAYIGGITAFGAATIALIQTDIKAVLAFSTISQLGYMVLGIGVGSYNAAFMHLITHAVFKACLFLSAGSVIHSVHTQEMPQMGGLKKKLKWTCIAMWCCTLAIAGVPFFSGFVSKDRILGDALYAALHAGVGYKYMIPALLGFIGAFLTPFYMFRMMFLTFHGKPRDKEIYDHCHAEGLKVNQSVPLLILAVFTLGFFFSGSMTGQGIFKMPVVKYEWFKVLVKSPSDQLEVFESFEKQKLGWEDIGTNRDLEKTVYDSHVHSGYSGPNKDNHEGIHHAHVEGAVASVIIVLLSVLLAFMMYIRKSVNPATFMNMFGGWVRALKEKYYFDHFYIDVLIKKGLLKFNNLLAAFDMGVYDRYAIDGWEKISAVLYKTSNWFDNRVVDSVGVDGWAKGTQLFNIILRFVQSGKVQTYFIILIFVLMTFVVSLT